MRSEAGAVGAASSRTWRPERGWVLATETTGKARWGCQGPDVEGLPALLRALDSVQRALGQAASEIERNVVWVTLEVRFWILLTRVGCFV